MPRSSLATLTATGLRVERGDRTILRDVSLTLAPGTRLGVVGPNGVGKSTLLRVLAGTEVPDAGVVGIDPPAATVGYLAQEHEVRSEETVRDHLIRVTGVRAAEDELAEAAGALVEGTEAAAARYDRALARVGRLAAGDLAARIDTTLGELGLGPGFAARPADALSGGERARVALAAVLLSRFDITLLDEPTNDLDFDGLRRLEAFVRSQRGAVVVVSHDRAFLDRVVTAVFELDEHQPGGRRFSGGWQAYLTEKATARRHAEEAYTGYRGRREDLLERARRERQWATSGVRREARRPRDHDRAQRNFRVDRTEQLAARARRTERALERLDAVDKPWEGWQLRFTIGEAPRAGAVVARLEEAVVTRGDWRLGPLDLQVEWGDRVALVGPNGSGKTTLVEAIVGRRPLTSGRRLLGPSVVVGELGQDRRRSVAREARAAPAPAGGGARPPVRSPAAGDDAHQVDSPSGGGESVLEGLLARAGAAGSEAMTVSEARSLLAKFGLGADQVGRPRRSLSPGERTRAELAAFQALGVNLLVLDEPTNHLDLPAIEQLEEALAAFGGTLLLVTHDRALLDAVELTRTVELGGPIP